MAGVHDGVVFVVGVDDPVVVAWKRREAEVSPSCGRTEGGSCEREGLTAAGQVAGQSLVLHEHRAGAVGVGH